MPKILLGSVSSVSISHAYRAEQRIQNICNKIVWNVGQLGFVDLKLAALFLGFSYLLSLDIWKVRTKGLQRNNILLGYPPISSTPSHGSDDGSKFIPSGEGMLSSFTVEGAVVGGLLGETWADDSNGAGAPGKLAVCVLLVKHKKCKVHWAHGKIIR